MVSRATNRDAATNISEATVRMRQKTNCEAGSGLRLLSWGYGRLRKVRILGQPGLPSGYHPRKKRVTK